MIRGHAERMECFASPSQPPLHEQAKAAMRVLLLRRARLTVFLGEFEPELDVRGVVRASGGGRVHVALPDIDGKFVESWETMASFYLDGGDGLHYAVTPEIDQAAHIELALEPDDALTYVGAWSPEAAAWIVDGVRDRFLDREVAMAAYPHDPHGLEGEVRAGAVFTVGDSPLASPKLGSSKASTQDRAYSPQLFDVVGAMFSSLRGHPCTFVAAPREIADPKGEAS